MIQNNKLTASVRMTELLKDRGKTEQDLATYLGIQKNSVRMWKYKLETPPRKYINQIAKFLGVSVAFLLTGVPNLKEDELPSDIEKLISLYSKLDELRKSEILSYMETIVERSNPLKSDTIKDSGDE